MDPRSLMGLYREREETPYEKTLREARQANWALKQARDEVRRLETLTFRLNQEVEFLTPVKAA